MASKRHLRKKACEWKRSFSTLHAAVGASISLRKRTGERTRAYRCPHCGKFHHGHTTRQMKQAMKAKLGY